MGAQGAVISSEELLARAWDEAADPFSNVVKVTVSRLRRKLGEPPRSKRCPVADTGSDPHDPAGRRARSAVRLTLRLRLTLLYGGVFIAAGAGLLAVTYGLFKHSQSHRGTDCRDPRCPVPAPGGRLNAFISGIAVRGSTTTGHIDHHGQLSI